MPERNPATLILEREPNLCGREFELDIVENTYIWIDLDELSCYIAMRANDHASEVHRC